MINKEELIANGYKYYGNVGPVSSAECLYQKCFYDESRGKLYYITFSFYRTVTDRVTSGVHESWEADIQCSKSQATMNLKFMFNDESTIKFVEDTCEEFFRVFKCHSIDSED